MPKFFPLNILVEEIALGRVMRLLNQTPGVVKVDLIMDKPPSAPLEQPKPNGRHSKAVGNGMSGQEFMGHVLLKAKRPLSTSDFGRAFEKDGRSAKSISSCIHYLKQDGLMENRGDGYVATRKLREQARRR